MPKIIWCIGLYDTFDKLCLYVFKNMGYEICFVFKQDGINVCNDKTTTFVEQSKEI